VVIVSFVGGRGEMINDVIIAKEECLRARPRGTRTVSAYVSDSLRAGAIREQFVSFEQIPSLSTFDVLVAYHRPVIRDITATWCRCGGL
jgi:hypothetical protein